MIEARARQKAGKWHQFRKTWKRNYWFYLFVLPTMVWFAVFCYAPMGGIVIAFKKYTGARSVWASSWVGLKWFQSFFNSVYAVTVIRNTILLSLYALMTFPLPILFALMLNELRSEKYKRLVQTVMYAPHFISTVVIVSMLGLFFSPTYGFVNTLIKSMGGQVRSFMTSPGMFRHLYVWSDVWQNLGWSCIIYVAALSAVDPELHEAAVLDGASRLQRILHINIPTVLPTIIITFIMRVGHIMNVGTDKVLLMQNDLNASTAQVIGTFVYDRGLLRGDYSYATAVGLFTNVVNLIMLLLVNTASRRFSETSLF